MAILTRKRLGPYEILSSIDAGGIGQVYRARNTLAEVFSSHRDCMPRSERETPALAALNNPQVAALYGLEGNFIPVENLAARHQQMDSGLKK